MERGGEGHTEPEGEVQGEITMVEGKHIGALHIGRARVVWDERKHWWG